MNRRANEGRNPMKKPRHRSPSSQSMQGRALLTTALLVSFACPAASQPPLPQNDGKKHLGPSSCSGPVCHSAKQELANIYGDEWLVWREDDRHSKAYEVLKNSESKRIAKNLGYEQPAWEVGICLDCHADHVSKDMRGPRFKLSTGVGCESCHGGSQDWASKHDNVRPHSENLADGMYPADEPVARAALCTSCHYGNKDKFVTHRIMGAGHPRMSFELQVFSNIQPAHFVVDDDYLARGKKAEEGMKVWAIGQVMSVRASIDALLDPKRNRDGAWPELVLFDCHACHHAMSEKRWRSRASTGTLGPGVPRLNDSSFLMVRYAFTAVDADGAKDFARDLNELHSAVSESEVRKRAVATGMRDRLDALIPKLDTWEVDAQAVRSVLKALLRDGTRGEFLDYAGAEQASLASQALFENLYTLGALSEATLDKVAAENETLLAIVADEENYSRAKATASFKRLAALVQ